MKDSKRAVITIDGPAGAGKSTVARALAKRLGYVYLDTGAIYRVVALAAKKASVDWSDGTAVAAVAEDIVLRQRMRFEPLCDGVQRVWLDQDDVSEEIRLPHISTGASTVSAHPPVRQALLELQRAMGASGGVVIEGRDTGTVVFPSAEVKFFLTASPKERARRRCEEMLAKGVKVDYEQTLQEIIDRDRRDSEREVAPLRRADDAIDIETTGVPVEQVIATMSQHVESACA